MRKALIISAAGAALAAGLAVTTLTTIADAHSRTAKAKIATADGVQIGTVEFKTQRHDTEVRVRLTGAPGIDAFHGFHIHANDDPANGAGCVADPLALASTWFVSADGHYNPTAATHSHHAGDLPSVYVNSDGSVETRFNINKIKPGDLNGRVVILHAGADNFANIPLGPAMNQYTENSPDAVTATSRTGNAGDRVACGVIVTR